jgi:spermidine/putrescine transport system permease protein
VFFLVPMYYLGYTSLQSGDLFSGYTFTWAWDNYSDAWSLYRDHFIRSFEYAAIATIAAFLISYPLAYWIAFRGGRWKNLLLLLIIAPFFVTYLIRTLAWKTILADDGIVVSIFQHLHLVSSDGRLLATTTAVIAGITYNFLPFMALPIYVSLEQIDQRLIEAAEDLYANRAKAFFRVTFPLSFIPAAGDFINAQLLGTPQQLMIGNVIQRRFKDVADYPQAAALSFVLMAIILALIIAYARSVGSERVTTGVA